MKLSLCTISFRHQLISIDEIAHWAARRQFQGIELWGVHARNLARRPHYDAEWLRSMNLSVPMVSDYLPLDGDSRAALEKADELCRIAQRWGARKLRTFAGNRASANVSREERDDWVARLRTLCEVAEGHGIQLTVETHPNTLADTQASTLRLIEEIDHPALRLNFDVIHVWEAGANPAEVLRSVEPVVAHLHLKNVRARELLPVFAPANVYAPAGSRAGMVPLFDGAFDFRGFLAFVMTETRLSWESLDASLEWFGPDVLATLEHDRRRIQELESEPTLRPRARPEPAPLRA